MCLTLNLLAFPGNLVENVDRGLPGSAPKMVLLKRAQPTHRQTNFSMANKNMTSKEALHINLHRDLSAFRSF